MKIQERSAENLREKETELFGARKISSPPTPLGHVVVKLLDRDDARGIQFSRRARQIDLRADFMISNGKPESAAQKWTGV